MIRSFMFRSDAKDKEAKADSGIESLLENKQSRSTTEKIPQPKDSADVLQQKLQQKFAEQRRKDMLAMQASQSPKAAKENEEVLKKHSVPGSTKQKVHTRAERSERRRKSEKAALGKKATKRSKRSKKTKAKPTGVHLSEAAEITTPTEPQTAEESTISIEASAGKSQETLGAEDKEVNDSENKGNVPGEQMATAQKLHDIMGILESSKNRKNPQNSVKVARKAKASSTDTKRKAAIVAMLNELQESGVRPRVDADKAAAMIAYYSRQLLAHLKANPNETPESLRQIKILHRDLLGEDDSLARTNTEDDSLTSSREPVIKKHATIPKFRRILAHGKEVTPTDISKVSARDSDVPGFISLRAALGQNSGKVNGHSKAPVASLDSLKEISSERVKKSRSPAKSSIEKAKKPNASPKSPIEKVTASDLEILPVKVHQPPVPNLAYGLERVLFNPGVYQLQDPRSRVYNFDPYLQKIMPVAEFDFNALKEYITSSRDQSLLETAKKHGKRYVGSTSSMTGVLAHFHFLLSQWRPINPSMLSKAFPANLTSFTEFQRIPSAIVLRWKDGSYAIDADKQFASANILSMLGKSMEKLLTLSTDDFERYRKSNPGQVTEDEQFPPESYHYSTLGDFLMRSQLDAHDPRLPGTGMFDLKTRSVVSIRMDVANYEQGVGYEIKSRQGEWESYEREYHDMIRAAFLKYSLQVRMGRMDGIFVAFHNIERIFGFQYISLPEMDSTLHGQWDTSIGDQEFRLSLDLMNKVLDRATKKHPETSLRIHFETRDAQTPFMYIFAEPVTEEQVAEIQSHNNAKIQEFERTILGLTRGNGSEMAESQDNDSKWENIQADVQEAMDKDELSVDDPSDGQEAIDDGAENIESAPNRPEVFEQGPLYANKSAAGVDDDVTAASAGSEEEDGNSEDDDDVYGGEEREEEEEEEEDEDANEDGEVENSRYQEGLEEILEDEEDIGANNVVEVEREVGGDEEEEKDIAPSGNNQVEVHDDVDLLTRGRNEHDTPSDTSRQESVDEAIESMDGKDDTSASPDLNTSGIPEEGQHEFQTQADQRYLDSIDQEAAQADSAAKCSSSEDILAMTITLRNKVNSQFVLRPEKMTAADEWSIEYSLNEVPEQPRARALYEACRRRRSKKMDEQLVPGDTEVISGYIQRLREMSAKGRAWRKEQDKRDMERPVEVL